ADRERDPGDRDRAPRERAQRRGLLPRCGRRRLTRRTGCDNQCDRGCVVAVRRPRDRAIPTTGEDPRTGEGHQRGPSPMSSRTPAEQGVLVVTGGSRGIGAQVVARAAADGWTVCFSYLSAKDRADALVTKIQDDGGAAYAVPADI